MASQDNKNLRVPYALAVYGNEEKNRINKVLDEHRTNLGKEVEEFENGVAREFGKKFGVMVNSGSSANLLAFQLLDLPKGSEVITPVLTFSTTVAPILQTGLVPVFADVDPDKYTINIEEVEKLITKRTKVLMIPLLLGSVPDMEKLAKLAKKHKLILIEDSCDTLGARYKDKPTGNYTDISTTSFFGSHIITAGGNGGMILVNKPEWRDKLKMLRGWGRSSSLFNESESIEKRFSSKIESIPYDAKFIFKDIGYNLLPSEIGAAFGNEQLKKLPKFRKIREKNFQKLHKFFTKYSDIFVLPNQDQFTSTQWLAFPLTIKKNAGFTRLELVKYLEEHNIQTRPIFTGNILRQPGFKDIKHGSKKKNFPVTDEIMERGFVIGCHHGLTNEHIQKLQNTFTQFLNSH